MKKYAFFLMFIILWGCGKLLCPAPDLRTSRQDYTGNKIRLDGIYHNSKDNQFFLYKNGIYHVGCVDPKQKNIPDKFGCSIWPDMVSASKNNRSHWSIFTVKNDSIYVEKWELVSDCTYDVFSYNGKIINDSTLIIPINRDGTKSDTFRFAKFSPKPDSTNSFIK
jgi:hypothetical protein